ncbi:hypothetical protein NDU88_004953 [Pleurodeles waltl]|uniref:Uncharacterized protein n=1 Tax=Pleurodeles waltl TaxID=8319 RepID=A0AAV7VHN9_PLEWA|nr:hypothetical protein NDU88_004953 [Pleurodeles waltl]
MVVDPGVEEYRQLMQVNGPAVFSKFQQQDVTHQVQLCLCLRKEDQKPPEGVALLPMRDILKISLIH